MLQAMEGVRAEIAGPQVEELLRRLFVKWEQHGVAPGTVEDLLDAIEACPHLPAERKRDVSERCAAALAGAESDLEVFRTYGELHRAKKIPPTEEGLQRVREQFLDALDWMLDVSGYSDTYGARQAISEVEDVAKALGVEIEDELERARDDAASLGDPDYDRAGEPPSPRRSDAAGEVLSDQDIDDMFSAL
jgi:hypothetical protein